MTGTPLDLQREALFNRIKKNYRKIKNWARANEVSCFRVYDKDIPDVPLCVDLWQLLPVGCITKDEARQLFAQGAQEALCKERTFAVMQVYQREVREGDDVEERDRWGQAMRESTAASLGIDVGNVVVKNRVRQRAEGGKRPQYQREDVAPISGWVYEGGSVFHVELSGKIDTGLFLDTRPLKAMVQSLSAGKRVLNLFCYTGGFSVCALAGGASFVESVDLSATSLDVARQNLAANGFSGRSRFRLIRSDVVRYLEGKAARLSKGGLFDIIILDPPTFSNSKGAADLDIRRQWRQLVSLCLELLSHDGTLFFSTNARHFKMDSSCVQGAIVQDISLETIPHDFRNKRVRKTWVIKKAKAT